MVYHSLEGLVPAQTVEMDSMVRSNFVHATHAAQRLGIPKPSLDSCDCWGWADSIKQSKRYPPIGGIMMMYLGKTIIAEILSIYQTNKL